MLYVKKKIYCEGTLLNFPLLYANEVLNPKSNKSVRRLVGSTTLKFPVSLTVGNRYYFKFNNTTCDDVTDTTYITGYTKEGYFTASSNFWTFEVNSVAGGIYFDNIEVIEIDAALIDVVDSTIELTKISNSVTDIENIALEHSKDFEIVNNNKAQSVFVYPNDNRITYIAVLDELQGELILTSRNDEFINAQFVSEQLDFVEKLKNITMSQLDIADKVFEITSDNIINDNDDYCRYSFADLGNYTGGNFFIGGYIPVWDIATSHCIVGARLDKIIESISDATEYNITGDWFDSIYCQELTITDFENYKDENIVENKCKFNNNNDYTKQWVQAVDDNNLYAKIQTELTDTTGSFTSTKFEVTENIYGKLKAELKVTFDTATNDSDGNELGFWFRLSGSVYIILQEGGNEYVVGNQQLYDINRYNSHSLDFIIDENFRFLKDTEYKLSVVFSCRAEFEVPHDFADVGYLDFLNLKTSGDYEIEEQSTIRDNTEYPLRRVLPNISAYEFLKNVINFADLQFDYSTLNKTFTFYTFDEYFISKSTILNLTNKVDKDSVNMLLPSSEINREYKYKYTDSEILPSQNDLNKLDTFTSFNNEGTQEIELIFTLPEMIYNNFILDLGIFYKINDKTGSYNDPYNIREYGNGTFLYFIDKQPTSKILGNELGANVQLNVLTVATSTKANKTLHFHTQFLKDNVREDYLQRKLNDLINPNLNIIECDIDIQEDEYSQIKHNTLIDYNGNLHRINKLDSFTKDNLTKFELISTLINPHYTGTLPSYTFTGVSFDAASYNAIKQVTTGNTSTVIYDLDVIAVGGTSARLKVITNTSSKYTYSTDGGITWLALTVGNYINVPIATNSWKIKLNAASASVNDYKLEIESYITYSFDEYQSNDYLANIKVWEVNNGGSGGGSANVNAANLNDGNTSQKSQNESFSL